MDIPRPSRASPIWRDRDRLDRIWSVQNQLSNFSFLKKNTNKSPAVSTYYNEWSYSDTVNFLLFLGCWTAFVAVPYLAISPIWFPRLAHHYAIPAVEVITMIFWFAGFIAMGATLPPPKWCHGSVCSSLQAATVFGAFEW